MAFREIYSPRCPGCRLGRTREVATVGVFSAVGKLERSSELSFRPAWTRTS